MVEAAALASSIEYSAESHFPLENIPFGAFVNPKSNQTHVATRIGDSVIDLAVLEAANVFNGPAFTALGRKDIFHQSTLNEFMGLGKEHWSEARKSV